MKWTLLALTGAGALGAGYLGLGAMRPSCDGGSCETPEVRAAHRLVPALVAGSSKAPEGVYLEARDATVWGGACHISSEAVSGGRRAALGWSFTGGSHDGVDLAGTQVVAVLEGSCNLQGGEVFATGEKAEVSSQIWVDAPSELVRNAALAFVTQIADLGSILDVHLAEVTVDYENDQFVMGVEDSLSVKGEALPDRSCCTMPESRWYEPLAEVDESVVGNPRECRFEGVAGSLGRWSFEGENSVFVASIASE
ncbi:hypothetical protein Poly30_30570 [Planctomycetes bacterium Poly30]|uniref:Uncharacterized protein n=1 Tax=Saltatorellus ferox TaxID=2528018 RepID=A0A518ETW2_9BACT|nr:hypothetical protein Poly30_30570 [Planctomycetes bacterium Poly30]